MLPSAAFKEELHGWASGSKCSATDSASSTRLLLFSFRICRPYLESDEELMKQHCLTLRPSAVDPPAHCSLYPVFVCPIQAYLESDEELIKEHCSPEMIERLTGIMRVQKQQVGSLGIMHH